MTRVILLFIVSVGIIGSVCAYPSVIDKVDDKLTVTPSQREKLEKFREVVADLLENDYERSDEYLLGYLRSKQWKILSAKQMLKIAKNSKRIHNIDELAKSNFSSEMLERFPIRLEGFDKKGCPLTEIPFGEWDITSYVLNEEFVRDGAANFLKHFWQLMAKMELRNRNSFPKCHQSRAIVSTQNYNMSQISEINSINAMVQVIHVYANYFPSVLYAVDIVYTPDSFMPIMDLVKTGLNREIYGIFKVHKGGMEDWMKDLDNVVNVDQRSRITGGTA